MWSSTGALSLLVEIKTSEDAIEMSLANPAVVATYDWLNCAGAEPGLRKCVTDDALSTHPLSTLQVEQRQKNIQHYNHQFPRIYYSLHLIPLTLCRSSN